MGARSLLRYRVTTPDVRFENHRAEGLILALAVEAVVAWRFGWWCVPAAIAAYWLRKGMAVCRVLYERRNQ